MASLRQYTNQARVRVLADDATLVVTDEILNKAEELIDLYCADFILPSLKAPFYSTESFLQATFTAGSSNVVLTSPETLETNYLKYNTVQILESTTETEVGLIFPVLNSANLTIKIDTDTLTTGTKTINLFQLGKFPRVCDTELAQNIYYKIIPPEVGQAATYQAWYITKHPELFDGSEVTGLLQSESIGKSGAYSYTNASGKDLASTVSTTVLFERLLVPQVKQLLAKYKVQTLI